MGIFDLLEKQFNWLVGFPRGLGGVINLGDVCCSGITICAEQFIIKITSCVVSKTTISTLLDWFKLIWNGFVKSNTEGTTNVDEVIMLIF